MSREREAHANRCKRLVHVAYDRGILVPAWSLLNSRWSLRCGALGQPVLHACASADPRM